MKLLFILMNLLLVANTSAADKATYRVTITSNWSKADHFALPSNAHFSPVVAVAHKASYNLLPMGGMTTAGLELVAELGRTAMISKELDMAKKVGSVESVVITENQFVINEPVQEFEVTVSKSHPYLSFVSMIAPSPDWVIGLTALKLYDKSTGFSEGLASRGLYAIDAGTESGDKPGNFSIKNSATSPQAAISTLSGPGFNKRFATLEVEKID